MTEDMGAPRRFMKNVPLSKKAERARLSILRATVVPIDMDDVLVIPFVADERTFRTTDSKPDRM